jgi:hypothetical protein
MSVQTQTSAIPISAGRLQTELAWEHGQHHVERFGASICTMSYDFFPFFLRAFVVIVDRRAIMDSLDSTLTSLSSRISSILLVTIRASHHMPNHAAVGLIACYPVWDASATVCLCSSITISLLMNGLPHLFCHA